MKELNLKNRWRTWRKIGFAVCLMCMSLWLYAQHNVSGTVNDQSGEPLPGVNISIKGTTSGVTTDTDGKYTLSVPDGNVVLLFSCIGYGTQEIATESRSVVNTIMYEISQALDEIVVVGYGSQSKAMLTSSVAKLDNKVLDNIPYANVGSALQGTLSGVRVQSTSGQPGEQPRIIIRGGTSINNPNGAAPLYIVDGIQRPNMNDINTSDIESVQVLKDAAATSIYGARGSNGVVIITTKSGKSGKTVVNYDFDYTVATTGRRLELLPARDYLYYIRTGTALTAVKNPERAILLTQATWSGTGNDLTNNTAYTPQYLTPENQYKLNEGWESMPDPLDPGKTIIFKGVDQQDIVFRTALAQNHSLSVSGGSDRALFNVGLGYQDDEGVVISTDYKRYSFHLNGEIKVNDKLKFGGKAMYTYVINHTPNVYTLLKLGVIANPVEKLAFEDGTLTPGAGWNYGNGAYFVSRQNNNNSRENLSLFVDAKWDILPGLTFTPQISMFQLRNDARTFRKSYFDSVTVLNTNRDASGSTSRQMQTQLSGVLSYLKSYDVHNLDARAGYEYFATDNMSLSASGRGAATDIIPTMNASAIPLSVSGAESHHVIIGYFSRINYDYDRKYLFSLNARYDGASNLGANHKWGFFPGVSAGWNMHRESFWNPLAGVVSQFKLRASYGVNGNISGLGLYQAQGEYGVGSKYDDNAAVLNTVIANQDLQWERSRTVDFGFDAGLLSNRLNVTFDYFNRITDDLLTTLALPQLTGFSDMTTNYGSLENRGVEMELSARIFPDQSPFQWEAAFNASKVRNKILRLPENGLENNRIGGFYVWDSSRNDYAWLGGLQEGGRIGDMFAYKQLSIYKTDEEAAKGPTDTLVPGNDKTKHGGDVNWQDGDGNGIIDERDRVYVGNPYPKWTGGFSNYFSYRNFSLSVRMDYTLGHMIYYETGARLYGTFGGDSNLSKDVYKSWKNQGDVTDYPRYYWADQINANNLMRGNSFWYQAGDFLCIREASLSYNIPSRVLDKFKISSLRFNVTGNNLHYFTDYKGLNPEDGDSDATGRYPLPRNIILGLHLSF